MHACSLIVACCACGCACVQIAYEARQHGDSTATYNAHQAITDVGNPWQPQEAEAWRGATYAAARGGESPNGCIAVSGAAAAPNTPPLQTHMHDARWVASKPAARTPPTCCCCHERRRICSFTTLTAERRRASQSWGARRCLRRHCMAGGLRRCEGGAGGCAEVAALVSKGGRARAHTAEH